MPRIIRPIQSNQAYYLDASFLCMGKAKEHFPHIHSHRITREVYEEIRNGKRIDQNTMLDNLVSDSEIIDDQWFSKVNLGAEYSTLVTLACAFHPYLGHKIVPVLNSKMGVKEKIEICRREVEEQSMIGDIWRSDYEVFRDNPQEWGVVAKAADRDLHRLIRKKIPNAIKSWYSYHKKRIPKQLAGSYRWTEELMVAAAATESFFRGRIVIILTNDLDFHTVFFNFTNNLILLHSLLQFNRQSPLEQELLDIFTHECQRHEDDVTFTTKSRYQNRESELKSILEKRGRVGFHISMLNPGDILLCYPKNDECNFYHYPRWLMNSLVEAIDTPVFESFRTANMVDKTSSKSS